jgi:hypothetical protein
MKKQNLSDRRFKKIFDIICEVYGSTHRFKSYRLSPFDPLNIQPFASNIVSGIQYEKFQRLLTLYEKQTQETIKLNHLDLIKYEHFIKPGMRLFEPNYSIHYITVNAYNKWHSGIVRTYKLSDSQVENLEQFIKYIKL